MFKTVPCFAKLYEAVDLRQLTKLSNYVLHRIHTKQQKTLTNFLGIFSSKHTKQQITTLLVFFLLNPFCRSENRNRFHKTKKTLVHKVHTKQFILLREYRVETVKPSTAWKKNCIHWIWMEILNLF